MADVIPPSSQTDVDPRDAELATLRARVTELEARLVEQAATTNLAVAAAQERAYWLDRWHLDLNAVMRRPGAAHVRRALRLARAAVRTLKRLMRRRA